jgi:low temperature requirement protein LtrA
VAVAQIGWIALIFLDTSVPVSMAAVVVLVLVEMTGPFLAERRMGGTPWHAHHIAERYGLLAIIALGEGVVGTVASLSAAVGTAGWSADAVLVAIAGTGLTFGMWWVYFAVPFGALLHPRRDRSFSFGYLHIVLFGAVVGTGAGLHAAAYYIEHHSALAAPGTVASVALPVGVFVVLVAVLQAVLGGPGTGIAAVSSAVTVVVLAAAVGAAAAGLPMTWCLLLVTAAPVATVLGREWSSRRFARDDGRVRDQP